LFMWVVLRRKRAENRKGCEQKRHQKGTAMTKKNKGNVGDENEKSPGGAKRAEEKNGFLECQNKFWMTEKINTIERLQAQEQEKGRKGGY